MTLQPRHISFALLLHAVLLALLLTSVQCSHRVQAPPLVQGVLINASKVPVPVAPAHPAQQPVPPQPQPQPDAETQLKQQQAQIEAQQKAQQEAQQKAQQEAALRQQQLEQQRQAEALKEQQAAAAEAQRQAQLKQQQEEAQRKADELLKLQQAAEEQKRAAEQARQQAQAELQKQLQAEAQKRQAAAATKRAAERKQALAEMQDQLGVEDAQLRQQEQLSWGDLLVGVIEKNWTRPDSLLREHDLYCTIHIDLGQDGQVHGASVTKSSGNTLFDESAVSAVYKASPLPLPQDMSAFQSSISVLFDPDKVAPQ